MMRNKILLFFALPLLFLSCEEEKHAPLFPKENAPQPLKDYSVDNISGASVIRFNLTDPNTLYVKAVYTLKEGLTREAKSSKYDNKIIVDGFAESKDYTVHLYSVSADERESDPIDITVHPDKAPYQVVHDNIVWEPDFGGGHIEANNPTRASLLVSVITRDSPDGEWYSTENYYTEAENIGFSFRSFNSDKRDFGVFVRDQWQNYSDTIFKSYEPWEESMIDMLSKMSKSQIDNYALPGDAPTRSGYPKSAMFDGDWANYTRGWYSTGSLKYPLYVTIELPGTYQLSRFKYMQNLNLPYGSANPKHFRVWGSMNPNPDGSMDDTWYLLGEFDNWKPSGSSSNTDEDIRVAAEGNEFTFPRENPQTKFMRFEILSSWEVRDFTYIAELQIWGMEF